MTSKRKEKFFHILVVDDDNRLRHLLEKFLNDLSDEGSKDIKHTIMRCKKEEPLTVWQ